MVGTSKDLETARAVMGRGPAPDVADESGAKWTPARLHARYASRVARQVRVALNGDEDAKDLVQEVLITVCAQVGRLRDPRRMDQWVAQITRAKLFRLFRRRRRRRYEPLDSLPEKLGPQVQLNLDTRDLATRAMKVLESVPSRDRALLMAAWFSPLTHELMAVEFGCTLVTLKRRLSRARTRFAKLARRDPVLASALARSAAWSTKGLASRLS